MGIGCFRAHGIPCKPGGNWEHLTTDGRARIVYAQSFSTMFTSDRTSSRFHVSLDFYKFFHLAEAALADVHSVTNAPLRNVDGSCSSDAPSLCKPTKMCLFTGDFSALLFLMLGVYPHTQQVSFDKRAADRNALPHSLDQCSTNFSRVYAFIPSVTPPPRYRNGMAVYQTLPPRPMT